MTAAPKQSDKELVAKLRDRLHPFNPTFDVIRLELGNYGYFDGPMIRDAIDQLERKLLLVGMEMDQFTPLEVIAILILLQSIGEQRSDTP